MMNDEIDEANEQIILKAFNSNLKLHIVLNDRSWRNGFVKELKTDFFMFEDEENGIEPIFFLQIFRIKPFREGEKDEM